MRAYEVSGENLQWRHIAVSKMAPWHFIPVALKFYLLHFPKRNLQQNIIKNQKNTFKKLQIMNSESEDDLVIIVYL